MSGIERAPHQRYMTEPLPAVPADADVFIVVHDRQRDIWLVGRTDAEQTGFKHIPDPDQRVTVRTRRSLGIRFSAVMHDRGSAVSTWLTSIKDVVRIMETSSPRDDRRGIGPGK